MPDGTEVEVHVHGDLTAAITLGDGTVIVETPQQLITCVGETLNAFKPEFD
jgi:hypothetical protein